MIPNMKFYVISIVAIFAVLGIGIYIGFILDTNNLVLNQKEDIAAKLEERFDFLKNENEEIKKQYKKTNDKNNEYELFINSIYHEIIKNRLENRKITIINTKDDYTYSGIEQILKIAGADINSIITFNSDIIYEEIPDAICNEFHSTKSTVNAISDSIKELMNFLITGIGTEFVDKLLENNFVDIIGDVNQPIDYIIIAGGNLTEDKKDSLLIDQIIISTAKKQGIPLVGIEKTDVEYSRIPIYKDFKISTIDNIDTIIGKISLILTIENRPGHYGSKSTADELFPDLNAPVLKSFGER